MNENEIQDKTIICSDCGEKFIWEVGEQKFYHDKGYTAPRRCPGCRRDLKRKRHEDERRVREVQHEL